MSDLHTDDPERAKSFYSAIFGWEAEVLEIGAGKTATMWRRPGYGRHLKATVDPGIRARQAGSKAPPGFEDAIAWLAPLEANASFSHWHVTFAVADRDERFPTPNAWKRRSSPLAMRRGRSRHLSATHRARS